jgi:hypothetical protein
MILWQSTKKHQNCIDDTIDPYQIEPSNPSNYLLIIVINSRKRVYYWVFQGEFDYQLYLSIGALILWQSTKKHQNCVDDDACRFLPIIHHQTAFQSSWIILILGYITQVLKMNLIINFVFQLELWFFGKVLKSTKIALMMMLQIPTKLPTTSLPIHQTVF